MVGCLVSWLVGCLFGCFVGCLFAYIKCTFDEQRLQNLSSVVSANRAVARVGGRGGDSGSQDNTHMGKVGGRERK